ncbi:SRPBCC family protein [Chitinophaga silvatica]|nr:SRPBCC family protein [Chitinophaga silvatica]
MKKILYVIFTIVLLLFTIIGLLELLSNYTASETTNKKAPVQTVQKIIINATPEKVYRIMSDVNNWATWHTDIQQPVLQGIFQKANSFNWKTNGLTIHSTIHTATPFSKIGWSGKAFGAFAIHNWTFTPCQGGTEVTVEESMEGWLVSLASRKFQGGLENSLQLWLHNLKSEAEK